MNIFEQAARLKLRFNSPQGSLTVEDLFELPLTSKSANRANLDGIAIATDTSLKKDEGKKSFVTERSLNDAVDELKLDILKHVIADRIAERDAKAATKIKAERKQKILEAISDKEAQDLGGKTVDELKTELASLG